MKTYCQGDTIRKVIKIAFKGTGEPVNLTGCTAYSQLRKFPEGDLIINGVTSVIETLGIVSVEFATNMTFIEPGIYGYDIRLVSDWKYGAPDIGGYTNVNPLQSGRDVITLYTTRIQIVKSYTDWSNYGN